jgi:hypothetical protein
MKLCKLEAEARSQAITKSLLFCDGHSITSFLFLLRSSPFPEYYKIVDARFIRALRSPVHLLADQKPDEFEAVACASSPSDREALARGEPVPSTFDPKSSLHLHILNLLRVTLYNLQHALDVHRQHDTAQMIPSRELQRVFADISVEGMAHWVCRHFVAIESRLRRFYQASGPQAATVRSAAAVDFASFLWVSGACAGENAQVPGFYRPVERTATILGALGLAEESKSEGCVALRGRFAGACAFQQLFS